MSGIDLDLIETDALRRDYEDTLKRCQDRRDVLQAALELLIAHVDAALDGEESAQHLLAALEVARKLVR